MIWQPIIAGFALGIISSIHCLGMCGPLVLALPLGSRPLREKPIALGIYHAGRIGMYAMLGLIFGFAGRSIYLAGIQQGFSVALGLIVLYFVVQHYALRNASQPALIRSFHLILQRWIFKLWKSPSNNRLFLLGMANGLLPCGMVYLAVAGALSTSQVSHSLLFMAMFGAGTLPAMAALSFFGHGISLDFRNKIRVLIPYLFALMGVLLILRGLNLGIPYISPLLARQAAPALICH